MVKKSKFIVGLIGNPNTGKSTLFNVLTGSKQDVANWPGTTVEKREGSFFYKNKKIELVDLPGAYSLTAYTEEESVTGDFIFEEKADLIVQVLDSQNLERNLFMTIQLIEFNVTLLLVLSMDDLAKKNGINIDFKKLSELLNIPVVLIDAKRKKGIDELMEEIFDYVRNDKQAEIKLTYGTEVNDELEKIKDFISKHDKNIGQNELHWMSLKLLEGDLRIEESISQKPYCDALKFLIKNSVVHLEKVFNKNIHSILASIRYGFIKGLSREIISRDEGRKNQSFSDKIDNVLINKYLGIPIFMFVAWLMFQATFVLSAPLMGGIKFLFTFLGNQLFDFLSYLNFPAWSISLLVDGVIGGVGGILVFVPIIGVLFFIMAILEDSGYMARVAYIMDKLMHRIGLHGKAFIPMILGFGCNVPAIMATRTLETKKDRLLSILINPFLSCSARLPVYVLFTGVFFASYQGWVIFSLYFFGLAVAIFMGFIFKRLFSNTLSSPFVIELPSYKWPVMTGVFIHSGEKVWMFIKKAGTVILAFSVILWVLASFPMGVEYGGQYSFAGQIGEFISPIFKALGFGNWQSSVALIFGFAAKEVIVGTFGTIYSGDAGGLINALQSDFTPLSAYSFMVFVLLYVPCIAVLSVVKKEMGSWKWPIFMIFYTTSIAWILSFIVFQGGKLLGFN